MSRIEELPDDFDESLDLNKMPDASAGEAEEQVDPFDALLDRAAARGGLTDKTDEQAFADFKKTPLFMTSLADAGDDPETNDMLEALQALQYDGTKAEIALNFKDQGNESIAEKRWADAREFYSKGLAVLLFKGEGKWEKPLDMDKELKQRETLKEQLFSNRARANLELKNYRSTTLDCAQALLLNPSNIKAYYRSTTALLALDKLEEAQDSCLRGLQLDPDNAPLKTLLDKIGKRSKLKAEQDARRKAEQQRKQQEKLTLATALSAREIKTRGTMKPPNMVDAEIRLAPDPLSPKSMLEFPTMFLYPMHNQTDFVKAFGEKDEIIDHLGYMLPLPWDQKGEYKLKEVDCYMDTVTGGMMKVGKQLSLLQVLAGGKTEVVDGLVRIYVVPKSLAPAWIEDVKKKKEK